MSGRFHTTRWSLVSAAARSDRAAFDELCDLYWEPVYAFLRRSGTRAEDAADLTQDFFMELAERNELGRVDAERGRFRSWVLQCLQHDLVDLRRREARRRSHEAAVARALRAEHRLGDELADRDSPQATFERAWARSCLDSAIAALAEEADRAGRRERFDAMMQIVLGEETAPYADVADRLGTTEGSVRVFVHRTRQSLGARLRTELARELPEDAGEDAIDEEVRSLWTALGHPGGA